MWELPHQVREYFLQLFTILEDEQHDTSGKNADWLKTDRGKAKSRNTIGCE